jgi:hypothetical protein
MNVLTKFFVQNTLLLLSFEAAAQCDVPTVSGNQILCNGQPITLTAEPGYSNYQWSNGTNGASTSVATPGVYQVTVTCSNGSTAFANVAVAGFTTGISLAGSGTVCDGQCALLSVLLTNGSNGPFDIVLGLSIGGTQTISVNPSGGGGFTIISLCPTETTTYTIQSVTNSQGCAAFINPNLTTATVNVVSSNSISIVGPTTICSGQTAVLTAQPSGLPQYQWSNGTTGTNTTISAAGTYTVIATLASGCTATATTTIAETPFSPPTISGGSILCPGDALTLTADGGPYTSYAWSTGQSGQSISVAVAGNYIVTVTDANGCTGTDSQVVSAAPAVTPNISGANNLCPNTSATLTATAGFQSYEWSTSATGSSISITTPGTYTVTVTNSNGCTGTAIKIVGSAAAPTVAFSASNTQVCAGGCLTLNLTFTGTAPFNLTYSSITGGQQAQTFASSTGTLQICPPAGTPAGDVTISAISLSDANCLCN